MSASKKTSQKYASNKVQPSAGRTERNRVRETCTTFVTFAGEHIPEPEVLLAEGQHLEECECVGLEQITTPPWLEEPTEKPTEKTQKRAKQLPKRNNFWATSKGGKTKKSDLETLCGKGTGLESYNAFSYNANALHGFWGWCVAFSGVLTQLFGPEFFIQYLALVGVTVMRASFMYWCDERDGIYDDCKPQMVNGSHLPYEERLMLWDASCYQGKGNLGKMMFMQWHASVGGLVRFVLGMFVSLTLYKTYYANRGLLGTVFAEVLGFCMMATTYVRPVDRTNEEQVAEVLKAQRYMVRLCNAGFRLYWIENRGERGAMVKGQHGPDDERSRGDDGTGKPDLMNGLLTEREWAAIQHLPSSATYIWGWIADCVADCAERGYIRSYFIAGEMHKKLEILRGANVWGLPSIPYPYSLIVTLMVKWYLILAAATNGDGLSVACFQFYQFVFMWVNLPFEKFVEQHMMDVVLFTMMFAITFFSLFVECIMYQGLLDLHTLLRDPNRDDQCGHLPVAAFVAFTKKVTTNLLVEPHLGRECLGGPVVVHEGQIKLQQDAAAAERVRAKESKLAPESTI